eukprot:5769662-Amphidinium_carterae.1
MDGHSRKWQGCSFPGSSAYRQLYLLNRGNWSQNSRATGHHVIQEKIRQAERTLSDAAQDTIQDLVEEN